MSYDPGRGHYSSDYAPGGRTRTAQFRYLGQRGGLKSGKRRRQLAKGRRQPHRRTRQQALSLAYRHRQLTRGQFARIYDQARPLRSDRPQAIASHERGCETAYRYYLSLFTRYRVDGNHYRTTNGQRGAALSRAGRPRCRRQLQRLARLMDEMGLAAVSHFKDKRNTPGHRDCLVVEIRSAKPLGCHPPAKAGAPTPLEGLVGAPPAAEQSNRRPCNGGRASPSRVPPPPAADEVNVNGGAPPAPASEMEEAERHVRFLEAKVAAGWSSPTLRLRLAEARHRLRAIRAPGSPPPEPRGSDG